MFVNALTKSGYSPKNNALLEESQMLLGTESTIVAGFKQWLELGRVVEKGQHGTKIGMVCDKKSDKADANGDPKKSKVFKSRTVFFESQTTELQPSQ